MRQRQLVLELGRVWPKALAPAEIEDLSPRLARSYRDRTRKTLTRDLNAGIARELLVKEGHYVVEADVLMVDLRDAPGQLARLSDALARAGVNIDYAYGSEDPAEVKMRLIVKASPLGRAEEVLSKFPEA